MFYLEKDSVIIFADENRQRLLDTLVFLPEYSETDIKEAELEKGFDGYWYLLGQAPKQDLFILKSQKIEEAKQAYTSAIQKITPDYPPDEKLSFDKQEAQALLYKQNPEIDESQILFIANLAKDKQEDLAVLVEKILQKKTQFEIYSAKYLGRKQRVEQLCKNAQTAEEAEAIDVAAIFNEPLE